MMHAGLKLDISYHIKLRKSATIQLNRLREKKKKIEECTYCNRNMTETLKVIQSS